MCTAYPLSAKCVQDGKCTPGTFLTWQPSTLFEYGLQVQSRVHGSVPFVNASLTADGKWPGTSLTGMFYVRYYGYLRIRAAGAYTLFLTSSTGGSGGRCQGGAPSVWCGLLVGETWRRSELNVSQHVYHAISVRREECVRVWIVVHTGLSPHSSASVTHCISGLSRDLVVRC